VVGADGLLALLAQLFARGERELEVKLLELLVVDRARRAEHERGFWPSPPSAGTPPELVYRGDHEPPSVVAFDPG
jgi:hypothetical protein